jgi:molecular chaperone GrpE
VSDDQVKTQGAGGADVPPVDPAAEPRVLDAEPEAADAAAPADAETPVEVEEVDPLTEAREQAAEYLQLAQRKQAEFENFRKRMQAQSVQAESRGVGKVAKELLAPLDHLGLAIEHADDATRGPLESVLSEFLGALGRVGVESFDPTGEAFDPNVHEAMTQQPVEGAESGTVVSVYQRGYKIGETVLRPARVVVAA